MRNNSQKIAFKPRNSIDVGDLTCLYRLHEGSGVTLRDLCGNGPDIALSGTPGTEWSANAGLYLTPNGTDQYARVTPAQAGVLGEIVNLDSLGTNAVMVGWDIIAATDVLGTSSVFAFGNKTGSASDGYFIARYSTAEALQLVGRANGDTTASPTASVATGADATGINTRMSVMLVFHTPTAALTMTIDVYVNGAYSEALTHNFNQSSLGTSFPSASQFNGLTLFGGVGDTPTPGALFNASGDTAGLANYWFRKAQHDAAQEAAIAASLWFLPGEVPLAARA